ncbi:mitochondrial thiamine pyrophosphate transporter [Entomortierella lignicola]|nr:mitochondrial thiamine pyrophosphate transporter [Entomortierella lignicola]
MAESGFASQGNSTFAFVESVTSTSHTFTTVTTPTTSGIDAIVAPTVTSTKTKKHTKKDVSVGTSSLTKAETVFCGSTAGVVSRFVIAPLDVVKIRLQMQTQRKELPNVFKRNSFSGSSAQPQQASAAKNGLTGDSYTHNVARANLSPKYRGMFSGMATIAREEGIRGLWKGNMAAEYLYLTYGGLQFLIYQQTKSFLSKAGELSTQRTTAMNLSSTPSYLINTVANSSAAQSFISGATAGIIATACTYPFDLLRTRFAVQRNVKVYTSVPQAFQHIIQKEGIRGFYKGMSPALIQVIPYMGVMFGSYDTLKQFASWLKTNTNSSKSARKSNSSSLQLDSEPMTIKGFSSVGQILLGLEDMLCGAISGIISKTVVYPLDMVRKRLQIQGSEQQKANLAIFNSSTLNPNTGASNAPKMVAQALPTSAVRCMVQIVRQEGYLALYKGLLPGLLKAAPASAVTFLVFSQMGALVEQIRRPPHSE